VVVVLAAVVVAEVVVVVAVVAVAIALLTLNPLAKYIVPFTHDKEESTGRLV